MKFIKILVFKVLFVQMQPFERCCWWRASSSAYANCAAKSHVSADANALALAKHHAGLECAAAPPCKWSHLWDHGPSKWGSAAKRPPPIHPNWAGVFAAPNSWLDKVSCRWSIPSLHKTVHRKAWIRWQGQYFCGPCAGFTKHPELWRKLSWTS